MGLSASEKAKVLKMISMIPKMATRIDELEDDVADIQRMVGRKKKADKKDGE